MCRDSTPDPTQPRGKWQISTAGGELPRWSGDGKELFYHSGDSYFAVDVKTDGKSFEAGIPKPVFHCSSVDSSASGGSPFVVTRDGQRFWSSHKLRRRAASPLK